MGGEGFRVFLGASSVVTIVNAGTGAFVVAGMLNVANGARLGLPDTTGTIIFGLVVADTAESPTLIVATGTDVDGVR